MYISRLLGLCVLLIVDLHVATISHPYSETIREKPLATMLATRYWIVPPVLQVLVRDQGSVDRKDGRQSSRFGGKAIHSIPSTACEGRELVTALAVGFGRCLSTK